MNDRFLFATAPVSWGVGDYRDASREQPYEVILDEIAGCGYTGTELGPFGYFPTDPEVLRPVLESRIENALVIRTGGAGGRSRFDGSDRAYRAGRLAAFSDGSAVHRPGGRTIAGAGARRWTRPGKRQPGSE